MSQLNQPCAWALIIVVGLLAGDRTARADDNRKPTVQTPMSRVELLVALREGHLRAFGSLPNRNRLAMAWAQVAFENGQGKWSWNHNIGNVAAARSQAYFVVPADHHRYRAFDSFVEGATAYWATVKHCVAAIKQFDAGSPWAAAASLKQCRYFEADLGPYAAAMSSLFTLARHDVTQQEADEQRRQQELQDATTCEYVQLIETADVARDEAARAASDCACNDR